MPAALTVQEQINADPNNARRNAILIAEYQSGEAFDDGWLLVRIAPAVITANGLVFEPGDLALAQPSTDRDHPGDFILWSARAVQLVGLRCEDTFEFVD
jgi:hypothetical protein